MIRVALGPGGYDGDVVINVEASVTDHFLAEWSGSDQTRFPARIRAAATAIRDTVGPGNYYVRHQDGHLSIARRRPDRLEPWADYTRGDVHALLAPGGRFSPGAGAWGLHGIVRIPERDSDFVFFVTYGQSQASHVFDEAVTEDGVLFWQSQPSQVLEEKRIRQFIAHDELRNTIHLFLRTEGGRPYTYLGPLAYDDHDATRERPVYFRWRLLKGAPPPDVADRMGLSLAPPLSQRPTTLEVFRPTRATGQRLLRTDGSDSGALGAGLAFIERPARPKREGGPTQAFRAALGIDFEGDRAARKELGDAGERLVVECEQSMLRAAGRHDLADGVRHVSVTEGDRAGYDVASFDPTSGEPRFIEVKTTRGSAAIPFYLSAREAAFAEAHPERYRLYRLAEYDGTSGSAVAFVLTAAELAGAGWTPTTGCTRRCGSLLDRARLRFAQPVGSANVEPGAGSRRPPDSPPWLASHLGSTPPKGLRR
ncbi:DUF3427 domain-containing protein [Rubrivirga sp. IMCC43871]|uniref:DUF3427 domain-containing protein n=1 Tax=Rubrivirga sp. IMCC43871 TaxID=3391575 RepID=UPI0039900517